MPKGSKIIHVGLDPKGIPCIWAEVQHRPDRFIDRVIFVVGTGNRIPEDAAHVGSFIQDEFVWHIYA